MRTKNLHLIQLCIPSMLSDALDIDGFSNLRISRDAIDQGSGEGITNAAKGYHHKISLHVWRYLCRIRCINWHRTQMKSA